MLRRTGRLADLLTGLRALVGASIVWLGYVREREALPVVTWAVILSWLSDLLDGPLARRDREHAQTWVGSHDAEADLATSVGLCLYLVLCRYVAAWLGVGLTVVTVITWVRHSPQLAWPLYAMPYAALILVVLREAPLLGRVAIVYLLLTLAVRWRRMKEQYLPDFLGAVREVALWRRPRA